jgi:hypothetical protein
MIACGKKEEVEVIPPYKIVVVRTCILKFLHSDPPVPVSTRRCPAIGGTHPYPPGCS